MYLESNLLYLRRKKGLLQKQIAQILKNSQRCISYYESDQREPTIENLVIISEFFKVSIDDLVKKNLAEGGN